MASEGLIVLAEDDARVRRLYVEVLGIAGFKVLAAADGIEALRLLSKVTPRLVILDIMMPNLDGIETCKRARKIIGGNIPILFLSALDRINILRDCVAAGGDDYLIKSDSLKFLVDRIKTWLHQVQRQDLIARRKKLLADFSDILDAPKPYSSEALPSKGDDLDVADLLVQIHEALQYAGPQFGKTPEDKLRLTGYITGIIEFWSETHEVSKDMSEEYLQAILHSTGLVTPADAVETTATYGELSKDTVFRIGRTKGRDDAVQRQSQGPSYHMTGLTDAGSTGAAGHAVAS